MCLVLVPVCVWLLGTVCVRQGDAGAVQHRVHLAAPHESGAAGQTRVRGEDAHPRLPVQDLTALPQVQRKGWSPVACL